MARLPQPGADNGTWGDVLNDFLGQVHNANGTLKDGSVAGTTLAAGAVSEAKLDSALQVKVNAVAGTPDWSTIANKPAVIGAGATQAAARTAIGAGTASTKSDVGLANVDNTSDANKPVSTLQQTAIDTASNADSVDGTALTTSSALQTLVNSAASSGKMVRISPGQVIAMSSTVTIPDSGGIVCDSAALWRTGAPHAKRPQLVAQSGFAGPMLKVGVDNAFCQGVRLRGFDLDANGQTGVTYGIYFNTAGYDIENSHRLEDVAVRRVTNGTGIAGRLRTSEFHNVNVFECLVGVKIGAVGPWFDTKWINGYVAYCQNKGIEMTYDAGKWVAGFVQFTSLRVERTGQLPGDANNSGGSPNWNASAPGWDISAAAVCTWTACTTDANNGPGVNIRIPTAGEGYVTNNLSFTNCIFNRDGQGDGTSMGASSTGINVAGLSIAGADHPNKISFVNCRAYVGESADDGSSSYGAPAYGLTVDHVDQFVWVGQAVGMTKGINFDTQDLWKPTIIDNYADTNVSSSTFVTSVPSTSSN